MITILIPIAGPSPQFGEPRHHFPKPLVEVDGEPMISRVVDNLATIDPDVRFIFVVRETDCTNFHLHEILGLVTKGRAKVVQLKNDTRGAACSCLMAIDHIDHDGELLVVNGDQLLDTDLRDVIAGFRHRRLDAGLLCFRSVHPKWSFALVDEDGYVEATAEKRPISDLAIAGFYYYARAADFFEAAMRMIQRQASLDGQYYISLTMNELVLDGKRIGVTRIPSESYHPLYSPDRIENYERYLLKKARPASFSTAADGASLTVVIPMAGDGQRFRDAGYARPKPFIDVNGRPMIEHVIDNLRFPGARFILIGQRAHIEAEADVVNGLAARNDCTVLGIDGLTEGTVCTILLARRHLPVSQPLLIANSDQLVDGGIQPFVEDCLDRDLDGSILCFRDPEKNPKWSFAKTDDHGRVIEVREKVPISDLATVGIYLFRNGKIFVDNAIDMIANNDRVNNEFYTCPVYNHAIAAGGQIGVYEIPERSMHGLGTPEDLKRFIASQ
ncbi:MAG: NTP transferase domain-containing protein [Alphaproteobacteria bacterium]|nr:NTP transferase domain-containing protein [Alphaproteobacteria bacterium]